MGKKDKKRQKKSGKAGSPGDLTVLTEASALKQKIEKLEKRLKERDRLIESLQEQIKKARPDKGRKGKLAKPKSNALFKRQTNGIGVMQKQARQRHGYLLHRYEYYLGVEQDKSRARTLAGQDLIDTFGADAGYTEDELENILS